MRRWLKMYDRLTLDRAAVQKAIKCTDEKGDNQSLLVHVAASHSGLVNGNRRFYRPDYMQQDVHTFLPKNEYPRPVLIGHNEKGDVLGRVREAKYVDESWKYAADFPIIKDSIFYSQDAKKHSLFKTVDWITDNLMGLPDYTGLGYIDLGLQITNPEAVRKFLAEEYLTVSVGFKTDSAVCSICHQDWAVDDRCEHRLGEMVDGKEMFLISGHFDYEEVSVVNFPADPFATTLSKKKLADSLEKIFFLGLPVQKQHDAVSSGLTMTDSLYDADINPTYEDSMANTAQFDSKAVRTKVEAGDLTAEQAFELKDQISAWEPATDADKTEKRSLTSTLNAKIRKNNWGKDAKPSVTAEEEAEMAQALEHDSKPAAKDKAEGDQADCGCEDENLWDGYQYANEDEKAFFEDEEGLYNELVAEMDAAVASGEIGDELIKDAKLSSESRKKMKKGTFCGPNRSFPVPDCAHVTAARRLVGRAKVSQDTKSKILACVSRKAKSLGCGDAKKDEATANKGGVELTDRVKKVLEIVGKDEKVKDSAGEDMVKFIRDLDKAYDAFPDDQKYAVRIAVRAMLDDWYADGEVEAWLTQLAAAKDSVVLKKKDFEEKEEAVNALSADVAKFQKDLAAETEAKKAFFADSKKSLATVIVMHKVTSGAPDYKGLNKDQINAKIVELAKRNVVSLRDTVTDILSELKWVEPKAADEAAENTDNRTPSPSADQPTVNKDEQVSEKDAEKKNTDSTQSTEVDDGLQELATLRRKLSYSDGAERHVILAEIELVSKRLARAAKK